MSATREQIVAAARSWIGVPWIHQGRTRSGVDCGGLIIGLCTELGMDFSAVPMDYPRRKRDTFIQQWCEHFFIPQGRTPGAPGDIHLYLLGRWPQHMAVWTGESVVHITVESRKVSETELDPRLAERLVCSYRLPWLTSPSGEVAENLHG